MTERVPPDDGFRDDCGDDVPQFYDVSRVLAGDAVSSDAVHDLDEVPVLDDSCKAVLALVIACHTTHS